jgi:predicted TIM-barrel fold metal-dependent hydrolase
MYNLKLNDYDYEVYEKEFKNFLPTNFIDCHAHIWKNTFTPQGEANGGSTWIDMTADELTAEDLMDSYKRLFPCNNVTPLVFGGIKHSVKECNDYVIDSAKQFGFPTLYRTEYSMSADELEENVKKGGFLGLKPYITNCPPYIPVPEIRIFDFLPHEHLEVADKNGWIVMLHIPRSMRLKDPVNLAQIMEIEEKYPNLKLIVAHIGRAYSKEDIGDSFELLKNTKNMIFDFTANLCDDAIKACIEAVGTKRLLFGSDLPIASMRMYRIVENGVYYNVVKRGMYGDVSDDPHMRETDEDNITLMIYEQIRALKRSAIDLKLTDSQVEDIMYGNTKRLLDGVK